MNLKLEIRENTTGQVASDIWNDWEYNTFWWEEGNAACDCNRSLFFLRALGEEEPEDIVCGYGKFSVRLSDAESGEILYNEFEEE